MRRFTRLAFAAVISVGVVTFGIPTAAQAADPQGYINRNVPGAQQTQREFGVPASVVLAVSGKETGWGESRLAREANNYFGIKCRQSNNPGPIATGCREFPTTECTPKCGPAVAWFRVYRNATDSFRDYGSFLRTSPRYAKAFDYTNDADQFIREVHKAGYATDPNYSNGVINVMRQYDLYRHNNIRPTATNAYRPAAVSFDGRTLVFGVSPAGRVYYREGRAGGSGWVDLAGSVVGTPSAVVSPDGSSVSVFVTGTDSAIYENRMAKGGSFTGWTKVGGQVQTAPIAVWAGEQLMVLAVDKQNVPGALTRPVGGSWSGWVSQGGYLKGPQTAIVAESGLVHVFGRGGDDKLYQNTYARGAWSGWVSRGGVLTADPTAVRFDDRVHVFAAGGGNRLYSISAPETSTGTGEWSGWTDLGGSLGAYPGVIASAAGTWMHVYVRGTDSKPYQQRYTEDAGKGSWSGWQLLPGSVNGGPVALTDGEGVSVYAIGTDQKLYTTTATSHSTSTGWTDLGGLLRN